MRIHTAGQARERSPPNRYFLWLPLSVERYPYDAHITAVHREP